MNPFSRNVAIVLTGLLMAQVLPCWLLPPTTFAQDAFPVFIQVDAGKSLGPLRPIWRFFGADEPNYAYMKDGSKLLGQLGELSPQSVFSERTIC
jgi:xylan 1,4-beta-xylosidase